MVWSMCGFISLLLKLSVIALQNHPFVLHVLTNAYSIIISTQTHCCSSHKRTLYPIHHLPFPPVRRGERENPVGGFSFSR